MTKGSISFRPIRRLFIANRGEVALRIVRSARAMGIRTIGLVSDSEPDTFADEKAYIQGESLADTYLNAAEIVSLALRYRADAIHPGYGFLSENADFARRTEAAGLIFVGPSPEAIELMGNKITARRIAMENQVPVTMSIEGSINEIAGRSSALHYPLIVKAAAGGGGKGMVKIEDPAMLADKLSQTAREAANYFGNDTVYLEQYIENPRHIEVQVFGDLHGNLVHLFERECSIQRRFQKIIEEAPAPGLSEEKRAQLTRDALALCRAIGYHNAGTVEFLLDESGRHYFLEMNTRLQVEHPVTESITGLDMVELQLKVAMGLPLPFTQDDIRINGHAIESRIYAENPLRDFIPSPGQILKVKWPSNILARTDTWFDTPVEIKPNFDPMLAKVITHAPTRDAAIAGHLNALGETLICGIDTNIEYLKSIMLSGNYMAGDTTTAFCSKHEYRAAKIINPEVAAIAALMLQLLYRNKGESVWQSTGFWRLDRQYEFLLNRESYNISWEGAGRAVSVTVNASNRYQVENAFLDETVLGFTLSGESFRFAWASAEQAGFVLEHGMSRWAVRPVLPLQTKADTSAQKRSGDNVKAPIPGRIVEVKVKEGDLVSAGDTLVVLEAMKMENLLTAPAGGRIRLVRAQSGTQVKANEVLVEIEPTQAS